MRSVLATLLLAVLAATTPAARATSVVPPEFATLVNDSDYIIRAVTKSVTAEKRTTERGAKIYTRVEFDVVEVIAGTAPATVTLDFLGGRVGSEVMKVDGMPQFKVGDEDILFVSGNGRSICPLYAMMHGRYAVRTEAATGRQFVARADGAPLQSVAQISAPLLDTAATASVAPAAFARAGLAPAAFISEIKSRVRPDARFNRAQN